MKIDQVGPAMIMKIDRIMYQRIMQRGWPQCHEFNILLKLSIKNEILRQANQKD